MGAGDRAGGGRPADDATFGMKHFFLAKSLTPKSFLESQPREESQFLTTDGSDGHG